MSVLTCDNSSTGRLLQLCLCLDIARQALNRVNMLTLSGGLSRAELAMSLNIVLESRSMKRYAECHSVSDKIGMSPTAKLHVDHVVSLLVCSTPTVTELMQKVLYTSKQLMSGCEAAGSKS